MTYDDLLEKMDRCRYMIESFEDNMLKGTNSLDFAFRLGEWKSTLLESMRDLKEEISNWERMK